MSLDNGAPASRTGRFGDARIAFWHVARFLAKHQTYNRTPFANVINLQRTITRGNYRCLIDNKVLKAVVTWEHVNKDRFVREHPKYVADPQEPTDGIYLTSMAGIDRTSLKAISAHTKKIFRDKDIYWDRHHGRVGHRPKKSDDRPKDADETI